MGVRDPPLFCPLSASPHPSLGAGAANMKQLLPAYLRWYLIYYYEAMFKMLISFFSEDFFFKNCILAPLLQWVLTLLNPQALLLSFSCAVQESDGWCARIRRIFLSQLPSYLQSFRDLNWQQKDNRISDIPEGHCEYMFGIPIRSWLWDSETSINKQVHNSYHFPNGGKKPELRDQRRGTITFCSV